MAAALAFGVISGAAASGYHYIFKYNKDNIIVADDKDGDSEDASIIELTDEDLAQPVNIEGIINDVSDVVEKVMPSIVSITSTDIHHSVRLFLWQKDIYHQVAGSASRKNN